jgi:hypothetical protein
MQWADNFTLVANGGGHQQSEKKKRFFEAEFFWISQNIKNYTPRPVRLRIGFFLPNDSRTDLYYRQVFKHF